MSVLRRLIEGLLLLFYEPYAEGATDSEKTFNPDIIQVNVTVNGTTIIIKFSAGNEIVRFLGRRFQKVWKRKTVR